MSILKLTSVLLISTLVASQRGPKRSRELTDKTFEHDTQATTGSTTGDWFVNFCSKSKRECREIEPLWDELTEKLFGRVSVAHVDLYDFIYFLITHLAVTKPKNSKQGLV